MSSQTTSETKIPDASPQEQELMNMITGTLLPQYLGEAGYDVTPTKVSYGDSDAGKALNSKRGKLEKQRQDLLNKAEQQPRGSMGYNQVMQSAAQLAQQIQSVDDEMTRGEAGFKSYTTYDLRKKENPELEYLKNTKGESSKEYKSAKRKYAKQEVSDFQQQERVYKEFKDRSEKYLKGDFSISKEQEALIQKNNAPVKQAIESMFKDNFSETYKSMDDFEAKAKEGGMSFSQGLGSVVDQIKTTGAEMEVALKNVVKTRQELLKQGIDDVTGEVTKRVAANAAALGRDPSDPEFTSDIVNTVAKEARSGNLELANLESQGLLGIRERTGGLLEQAAGNRGAALTDYESGLSKMRTEVGSGMPPSQLQVGMGGMQYNQALAQQRLANAAGTAQFPMFLNEFGQRERMAQPTTTQTTPFGPADFIGAGLGIAGAGANIYGAVSSAGALRKMFSSQYGEV